MTGATCPQAHWVRAFVGLYLEVEAGLRPARHIRPLMALDLQPVVGNCGRQGRIPDVLTVHMQTRRGVCEAVVLLSDRGRVSALAIGVRREEQGWRITEVRRPDDPKRPVPGGVELPSLVQTSLQDLAVDPAVPSWGVPCGWRDGVPGLPVRAA